MLRAADNALTGIIAFPTLPQTRIAVPFNDDDLDHVPVAWQLPFAGLSIPRLLLDAYAATGREEYLNMARDMIVAFASYEKHAWLPKGFLWNDHAIAARVYVLADFWRYYRNHPGCDPKVAAAILELAARSGQLLADPKLFTFGTSHGVVQNLALWHLSVVFPCLPDTPHYGQLALDRLVNQTDFLVNEEGVVVQHSAGYHKSELQWLGMSLEYLRLLDLPVPEDWKTKYAKAKDFYAALVRPDGSLPMFGDTQAEADPHGPLVAASSAGDSTGGLHYEAHWRPSNSARIYPGAGYAVWWDGLGGWPDPDSLDQTVVAWSYFPYLGHKHADETSVLLWARGSTWWTNVGYWPYGTPDRPRAESWAGSNAPHSSNEGARSARTTLLNWFRLSPRCRFLDLMRSGPDGFSTRRQILQLPPDLWIVVDHNMSQAPLKATTIWTTSPEVSLRSNAASGSYDLSTEGGKYAMQAFLFGSPGTRIREFRGSAQPFAGWQVVGSTGHPTSALMLEQSASDSWATAVWSLRNIESTNATFSRAPFMKSWSGPEHWELVLPTAKEELTVRRDSNRVSVRSASRSVVQETLEPGPDVSAQTARNRAAYQVAAAKYPRFKDYVEYRSKVSYLVIALFLLQELLFFVIRRMPERLTMRVGALSVTAWTCLGIWLVTVFFRT
jgi:hypothetical protein